jgi:type IV pilus assembly protein PilE
MRIARPFGFTLIELMITVVIMAILAGIAYPAYNKYATQARRSDAQVTLQQTANRLEKFFTYCNSYPAGATPLTSPWPGSSATPPCPRDLATNNVTDVGLGLGAAPTVSPDRHYVITMVTGNITGTCATGVAGAERCGYTITADPNGGGTSGRQRNDGKFRLDATGRKEWDRDNDNSWEANENTWK